LLFDVQVGSPPLPDHEIAPAIPLLGILRVQHLLVGCELALQLLSSHPKRVLLPLELLQLLQNGHLLPIRALLTTTIAADTGLLLLQAES